MRTRPNPLSSAVVEPGPGHAPDDMVDEVAGPPFSPVEAGAAIALGVLALLVAGLMSLLLAALAEEHRLSASGIGLAAMAEALSTGLVTGAAGILIRPVRLKTIALVATLAVIALDLATLRASGMGVLAVRTAAGVGEGVLLWISIGFISRTATPERWAAVLFTGMGLTQLIAATGVSALVLPRFGANGGYVTVAAAMALALPVAFFLPARLGATHGGGETAGAPPLRGWVALIGTLAMASSLNAVAVYLIPLARQAGLDVGTARAAVPVALACQMLGGVAATAIAGRVRYLTVFLACAAVFFAAWAVYATAAPGWLFLTMAGLTGFAAFISGPFLVPMTVEADPSRRAAMQSGAVQLLAGALGPLLASQVVSEGHARGVLALAAGLQIAGLAIAIVLHRLARTAPAT
jgi:hypothetical protein